MPHIQTLTIVAFLAGALALTGCTTTRESNQMEQRNANPPTRAEWDAVATRTIFFGHQSVGENILDGLKQIGEVERWPGLRIIEPAGSDAIPSAAFVHAKIGQNGDPHSKVAGFQQALDAGAGRQVDVAMMKFCFWDIRRDTNVDAVFQEYERTLTGLEQRYPNVTFLHATVPLVAADVDWRARARRLVGMSTPTDEDNRVREALNQRIRQRYGSRPGLFDIAMLETDTDAPTNPPQLAAELSSDGAHLNTAGRRRLGAELIKVLSAARVRTTAAGTQP